jgi:hypothetical protein
MTAPFDPAALGIPRLEDMTLTLEQHALLHLFDRLRHLEDMVQAEMLRRERSERTAKARIDRLKAELDQVKRGAV